MDQRKIGGVWWQTSILGVGTLITHGLNYGFHIITARVLTPEEYASITTLLAVFMIISIGSQVLQTAVTRLCGIMYPYGIMPLLVRISVGYFLCTIVCVPLCVLVLHLPWVDSLFVLLSGALVLVLGGLRGVLQGTGCMALLSQNLGLESLIKLLVFGGLFWLGLRVTAGTGALLFSALFSTLLLPWRSLRTHHSKKHISPVLFPLIWHSLGLIALFTLLYNIDQILVRAIVPEDMAVYGVMSRLGQLTLFGAVMLTTIWFSRSSTGLQRFDTLRIIILLLGGVIGSVVGWYFLGEILVPFFFGQQYTSAAALLPIHALSMGLLGFQYFISHWCLVRKSLLYMWSLGLTLLLFLVGVLCFVDSLESLVYVLCGSTAIGFVVLMGLYYATFHRPSGKSPNV